MLKYGTVWLYEKSTSSKWLSHSTVEDDSVQKESSVKRHNDFNLSSSNYLTAVFVCRCPRRLRSGTSRNGSACHRMKRSSYHGPTPWIGWGMLSFSVGMYHQAEISVLGVG